MNPSRSQSGQVLRSAARTDLLPRRSLIEWIAAGTVSAVFVCRLLTPTDGAMTGETLWISQFSLLALLVWVFAVWKAGALRLRIDWLDVAVFLLCLGHVVGALAVIATTGDKRAAMTMLWEWVGLLVTFFLMRRQLADPASRPKVLLLVASVPVALAGLGIWQHHFGFVESRRQYEELKGRLESLERAGRPADREAALDWDRSLSGVRSEFMRLNIPADDGARMLWEQRLYSVEPIALFALANTLAGILAVAAMLWFGALLHSGRRVSRAGLAAGVVLAVLVVYCLLLTKSRTAWVGLIVGIGSWGLASRLWQRGSLERLKRPLAAGIAAIAVLAAVAFASGGLDRFVVSESAKSLRYRMEYWTATWRMLAKSPRNLLLGVGPGNFRQNYLEFKLPESSEEIADPHNLVLDVWANGGLTALIGLAGIAFVGLCALWQRPAAPSQVASAANSRPAVRTPTADAGPPTRLWSDGIVAGGAAAFVLVLLLALADETTLAMLLPAWILIVLLGQPIFAGELPRGVTAGAFAALFVHLMGAGGIGMPGVSQVLLLLAAMAAPAERALRVGIGDAAESERAWHDRSGSRNTIVGIGVAALALYLACWDLALAPLVAVRGLVASAKEALFDRGQAAQAERDFLRAAEADPWSAAPCERLAEIWMQRWLSEDRDRSDLVFTQCLIWQKNAIQRDPRNPGGYSALGEFLLSKGVREDDSEAAIEAADAFRHALELYPNRALGHSQLAEALWRAGDRAHARSAARQALALDDINRRAGHLDKLLPETRRKMLADIERADSN